MQHKWFLIIGCAWFLWSDHITSIGSEQRQVLSPPVAYDSYAKCETEREAWYKYQLGRKLEKGENSKLEGNIIIFTRKDGTLSLVSKSCYPSDFDYSGWKEKYYK